MRGPSVGKRHHQPLYPHRWDGPYVVAMGNTADDWSTYLRRLARRDGWSVARLARESGVNRSTIQEWIRLGGSKLTIASVLAIAKGAGDDPATALLAAGNLLSRAEREEADEVIALVWDSGLPESVQAELVAHILDQRRRDQERQIADVQQAIRLAGGQVRDVG